MPDRVAIDTGPLITLAHAGALDVVGRLTVGFVAPEEVRTELDAGTAHGHPAVTALWLRFEHLREPLGAVARAELGAGEAAVIQLAGELSIDTVAIDERKGRRAAMAVGLRVTGTLGLIGRAKRVGLITAVGPFVDRLRAGAGWFDDELLAAFVAGMGE